ncbi:MAG: BON domain-containing protein [Chloroflexota bacterium]|nr:BON domain-containing protein [Chloroflexota bacterium]
MPILNRWTSGLRDARDEASNRAERVRRAAAGGDARRSAFLPTVLGALLGALTAYLLDPDKGRDRRARLRETLNGRLGDVRDRIEQRRRRSIDMLEGRLDQVRQPGETGAVLNDASLAAKVETELFADQSIAKGKINVNVEEGVVVLRGEVDTAKQRTDLVRRARRIPGVADVTSLLHLPGEPAPPEPPRHHPATTIAATEEVLP